MREIILKAVRSVANKLGYTVIPSWRLDGLPLEQHLRRVFRRFSIDTVFDIGANAGQYHDFLRQRVQFDGVIHSFEPVATLADKIAARAQSDMRWHLHRYALGAEEATLEINVTQRDTFSSFLEADVDESSSFASSMIVKQREQVLVKRVDDIWRDLVSNPGKLYLKVDTQGFDLEVLRGSIELLRAIKALQFELSIQPIYKGTQNYLDILRQLNEWGFVLSGLFPICSDDNLRIVEVDCVMVARL